MGDTKTITINGFLSTPSARRATSGTDSRPPVLPYFYPRPLRGGRPIKPTLCYLMDGFLSTPSARRATKSYHQRSCGLCISIHALCEEGDF